jgi:predicted DNA binding CopG/RHH family protein
MPLPVLLSIGYVPIEPGEPVRWDMNRNKEEVFETMKELPRFKSEDEERKFWETADSTKCVDWPQGRRRKLVQLKPSLCTISLRLPVGMIEDLKLLANQRDVPYQSLLKAFLAERIAKERPKRASGR